MRNGITFVFIFIAVSSVLIFTSTDIVTLFANQHAFFNISGTGNQISCTGCHHHIADELNLSAIHEDLSCEACHRFTGAGITFASGESGATPGEEAHAAYTPRCLDCHGESGVWVEGKYAPPAPAFNQSSAHRKFVERANESNLSVGENEACLACHTNYSAKISYSYFYNIDYTVYSWNVPFYSFSYNGTRYYDISWSKSGAKHEFLSLNDIDCTKCHKNIYDALVNGTPNGTNEDYLTHAPIEIDTGEGGGKDWDTDNPWNHYRYHYIPSANRPTWVNNSYCFKCHNVDKYADEHPADNATYDLGNVTADTNSTDVHAAEALTCATCHGSGKTKEVIDNLDKDGGCTGHSGTNFVDDVASTYARTFNGDICMGCHEAAVHPDGGGGGDGECSRCHKKGDANVYIQSEPSGYATNT